MRIIRGKGIILSAAVVVMLLAAGTLTGSTVEAQNRHERSSSGHNWSGHAWSGNRGSRSWNRDGAWNRNRFAFVRPRVRTVPRVYVYPRYYPYYGGAYRFGTYPYYYGTSPYVGGSYYGTDQQGYHDGLDRGREDARDGRSYNPNNSSHFRNSGSAAYRDGFRRGYDVGYREYAGYRRW